MKAGHVGSTVLCGGAMKQRIKYSFYQAKCIYKKISLPCFLVTKLPVCWVVVVAPAVGIGAVLSFAIQSEVRDSTTDLTADFGDVEVHFGLKMPNPLFTLSCGDLRVVIQVSMLQIGHILW